MVDKIDFLKNGGKSLKVHLYTFCMNSGPKVIKLFPCSTQLSAKFILLINVKMSTIFGILTFMSMINAASERLNNKLLHLSVF